MTQVSTPLGFKFPYAFSSTGAAMQTSGGFPMAAAGNKHAHMGMCYIEGRATSKVLSSAGGGSIGFLPGVGTVFANAGTTLKVGIQDIDATTGIMARPDGTFDVEATLVGGTDTLTSSTWKTVPMEANTKTISHGQRIAVVFDMISRGGSDSVEIAGPNMITAQGGQQPGFPFGGFILTSTWDYLPIVPNILITFDDGTLGTIDFTIPSVSIYGDNVSDTITPDEMGIIFQVPWDCKIDGLFVSEGLNGAGADMAWNVYSTPLGTPASIIGGALTVEDGLSAGALVSFKFITLPTQISLTKNTDYCFAIRGTGTGSFEMRGIVLPTENARKFMPGGTTVKKATRNNGSGAFTAESPAITTLQMGVRICSFEDSAGGGAAGAGLARVHGGF